MSLSRLWNKSTCDSTAPVDVCVIATCVVSHQARAQPYKNCPHIYPQDVEKMSVLVSGLNQ